MQVQMRNIAAIVARSAETNLSIHVSTIEVNLTAMLVNQFADFGDTFLEYSVC